MNTYHIKGNEEKVFNSRDEAVNFAQYDLGLNHFGITSNSYTWELKVIGDYRYRISSTGDSSEKYGKCQCCNKHASEMFQQVEEKIGYSHYLKRTCYGLTNNKNLFGHKECLEQTRKLEEVAI